MTPSHALRRGKRYRYYVSQSVIRHAGTKRQSGSRIPAHELEQRICERLGLFLSQSQAVLDELALPADDNSVRTALIAAARTRSASLERAAPLELRQFLTTVLLRITIGENTLEIEIKRAAFRALLLGRPEPVQSSHDPGLMRQGDADASVFRLELAFVLRRYGGAAHLVVPRGTSPSPAHINVGLIRALACVGRWYVNLISGQGKSQPRLAKELGVSARYLRKIIPCAFLAPDIVEVILEGRQPPELTLAQIVDRLPTEWNAQRRKLGFNAAAAV